MTPGTTGASTAKAFRKGDRVIFTGSSTNVKQSSSSRPNDSTSGTNRVPPISYPLDFRCLFVQKAGGEGSGGEGVQGPRIGNSGRVVLTLAEDPQRIGVCFDAAVPGGTDLGEKCESGHGYYCDSADLRHEGISKRIGQENMIIDSFFEVAQQAAAKKPLVIHIQVLFV